MSSTASIANSNFLLSRIMMDALPSRGRRRPGSRFTPRRGVGTSGSDAGRAEGAGLGELADDAEFGPRDPGEHQLGDAVAGVDPDAFATVLRPRRVAVPGRD